MNKRTNEMTIRLKKIKDKAEAEAFDKFVEKIIENFKTILFYKKNSKPCILCNLSYRTYTKCPNQNKNKELCYLLIARIHAERLWDLNGRFM